MINTEELHVMDKQKLQDKCSEILQLVRDDNLCIHTDQIIEQTKTLDDDGRYKISILKALIRSRDINAEAQDKIIEVTKTIKNDDYKTGVFKLLGERPNISLQMQNQILGLTEIFVNDHHRSHILEGLASNPNIAKETQDKIIEVTKTIKNDDYKTRVFSGFAKNNINQIFQIVKTFEDDHFKAEVFIDLISKFNLTEEMKYDIFEQTQTINYSDRARVFSSLIKYSNLTDKMKHDILQETKTFEDNRHKFMVCIEFMNKDASNFTEVIQIVATDYEKKAVLNEMLFSAYNANINNKEGFKDRLQTYLPKVDADETFRIIQLMASNRPTDTGFIFIGYDKPLELFHKPILFYNVANSIFDKIQNALNMPNTSQNQAFANMIQNQNGVGGQGMGM